MLSFSKKNALQFINEHEVAQMKDQLELAQRNLLERTGPGSDFLGWVDLPVNYDKVEFDRILKAAEKIRHDSDVLVVTGIGGSYLGARAVIDALSHNLSASMSKAERKAPLIVYAGHQLSGSYLAELMAFLDGKDVSVNIISKSGTTTEPAIAFRILKNYMENRYGAEEAGQRIYATTDKARGALKGLADKEGYESFVVPDDVGGRYSFLTAVGLLPIAVAGIDIKALMQGAARGYELYTNPDVLQNPAALYAATRNVLLRRGYGVEIMVNYEPSLHFVTEWWKQLFGESEGKDGKGIFPAGVDNTSDLHSMGQYIQDGQRFLFETVLRIAHPRLKYSVPSDPQNLDGLNFLAGMDMAEVNDKAIDGTILAHIDGGVPNLQIEIERLDEANLGELLYFYEMACGISGHLNAVNPFNQPGVEAYKKNMFALLGKPGYESEKAVLEARLDV